MHAPNVGSVTCRQVWEKVGQSQLAAVVLVLCGQMVVYFVLDGMNLGRGPVLAVAAGDYHSCAARADGRLVCFG